MTDNEIIKALECCKNSLSEKDACRDCPLYEEEEVTCITILSKNALDLINRQKAEIDILIRKKDSLRDEIAELQAENERLEDLSDQLGDDVDIKLNYIYDLKEKLTKAKAEAIKEFAKLVTRRLNCNTSRGAYLLNIMNEVKKEMTN